jgi:hypothetical protein
VPGFHIVIWRRSVVSRVEKGEEEEARRAYQIVGREQGNELARREV